MATNFRREIGRNRRRLPPWDSHSTMDDRNRWTDLCQIHTEDVFGPSLGWVWMPKLVKFWWRSGSPSGYRNRFLDSSLLGDTENGINRLRCATLQGTACNSDVITSPAHDRQPPQPVTVNDVAKLVRRVLAEVCTVPLRLVNLYYDTLWLLLLCYRIYLFVYYDFCSCGRS